MTTAHPAAPIDRALSQKFWNGCRSGDTSNAILSYLSKPGIDVNERMGERQLTPFLVAAQFGRWWVLDKLLQCPAVDVNARDTEGATAVWHAAGGRHDRALAVLLHSASVPRELINLPTMPDGLTPLHKAVSWGSASSVHMLLVAGADPSIAATNGLTVLESAVKLGFAECVRELLLLSDPPAQSVESKSIFQSVIRVNSVLTFRDTSSNCTSPCALRVFLILRNFSIFDQFPFEVNIVLND